MHDRVYDRVHDRVQVCRRSKISPHIFRARTENSDLFASFVGRMHVRHRGISFRLSALPAPFRDLTRLLYPFSSIVLAVACEMDKIICVEFSLGPRYCGVWYVHLGGLEGGIDGIVRLK